MRKYVVTFPDTLRIANIVVGQSAVLSEHEPGSTGDYWPATYPKTGKRVWINLRHVVRVVEERDDA